MASFKSEYAVSLECEDCVQSVRQILKGLDGVESYDIDLKEQRVTVQGKCKWTGKPQERGCERLTADQWHLAKYSEHFENLAVRL